MRDKIVRALYLVLSLLMAVAFWLYVDEQQENTISTTFYNIPVEFIGAEDTLPNRNLMLIDGQDATLNVTVSGSRMVISNLTASDFKAQVNLSTITSVGTYPMAFTIIRPDNISESEITFENYSRSTITVQVGTMYSRNVPVDVQVVGEVPDGYIYMASLLVAQPSELTLRGMAEDVDQVASAQVVVDLTGATASIQRFFDYELLDAEGNVLELEDVRVTDRQVQVTAPVYLTKELPLTVKVKEAPGSLESYTSRCELDVDTITLAGEPASLENVEEIVLGEVDLSQLLSDTEIPFDIAIPAGCVNLSSINSAVFTVRFKRNMEINTYSVTNISAIGLTDAQEFNTLTNSIDVQVRGPAGSMDELTAENIRIVVDLTQYVDNGTYSVPARVLVDGNDTVGAVGAYTVACKITSK